MPDAQTPPHEPQIFSLSDATVKLWAPTRKISGKTVDIADMILRAARTYPDCCITYDEHTGVRIEFSGAHYV
jgi:hypothetical protein